MLTASKPLVDEPDKFVNGYGISGGIRMYTEDGKEYDDDEEIPNIDDLNLNDLLVLNTQEGYEARTREAESFVTYGPNSSNPIKNEAGWICEYYFGLDIAPFVYGGYPIYPLPDKFRNEKGFKKAWDFEGGDWTVDVKAQSITDLATSKRHTQRKYYCQLSKFKEYFPSTNIVAIWWAEIDNFDSFVLERKPPQRWKYFEVTQQEWANEYYIDDTDVDTGGLYKKNMYYNERKKRFEDVRIAYLDKQGGEDKGLQLVFYEKWLVSFPY